MQQVLQDLKTGRVSLIKSPLPSVKANYLLIQTSVSLLSSGTERMLLNFGKAGLIGKIRQQPDKVKEVIQKIKADGLMTTIDAVKSKLEQPLALGYCNVGKVIAVGAGVSGFEVGDRVLSNGAHAEVVHVGKNLCVKIPDCVSDEEAAFGVLGSIGLEGIRLAAPTLGESFVVIGLGLIGLLTAQLLKAQGCRVLGVEFDASRCQLANSFGIATVNPSQGEDPIAIAESFSRGCGVDGVLITASTASSEPVHQAAMMCRQRGRVVLVGVTGLELSRADFYKKELSFQVSCSYGPGRYDAAYEEKGIDYPFGFVRWTEQRNMVAVLDMMAQGQLEVKTFITHRFDFSEAPQAYEKLEDRSALGILLHYRGSVRVSDEAGNSRSMCSQDEERTVHHLLRTTIPLCSSSMPHHSSLTAHLSSPLTTHCSPSVAFFGAGNYASRMLIPAFKAAHARLHTIVSSQGLTSSIVGRKYGFRYASTDDVSILANPEINVIVIATRHDLHAAQTIQALNAGKHVFVEKPLAISYEQLEEIKRSVRVSDKGGNSGGVSVEGECEKEVSESDEGICASAHGSPHSSLTAHPSLGHSQLTPSPILMVGFNRRFAPHSQKIQSLLSTLHAPKNMVMTVNAGFIPKDHWAQDPEVGGGRLVGEACHFVDLLRFFAGSKIVNATISCLSSGANTISAPPHHSPSHVSSIKDENVTITLGFEDGSQGTVHYFANGHKGFPKEQLEIFSSGKIIQLDNFIKMKAYGFKGFNKMNLWRQDKGQKNCVKAFVDSIEKGLPSPIAFEELIEVSEVCLTLRDRLVEK